VTRHHRACARARQLTLATVLTAVLVAGAGMVGAVGVVAPGVAQGQSDPGDVSSPATAVPIPEPVNSRSLTLVNQTTFVAAGDAFELVFAADDVRRNTTITLTLHPPITSRSQFVQTLEGSGLGAPVLLQDDISVADLRSPGDGLFQIDLVVPGDEGELQDGDELGGDEQDQDEPPALLPATTPGVWPLVIERSDRPDDPMVTHVVRLESADAITTDRPTLSVGMVVEVATPVRVLTDGTSEIDPSGVAGVAAMAGAVGRNPTAVTLAPQPATLQALAAAGPAGQEALAGLAAVATDTEVLAGPWVPLDTGSLAAGDMEDFIGRQWRVGDDTIASLLGVQPDRTTAIVDGYTTPRALEWLTGAGVRQVVVPENIAEPIDTTAFPVTMTRLFEVDATGSERLPALQTDLVTSGLLASSDQPALAANRVLADLAVLAFDLPDIRRAVIISTGTADGEADTVGLVLEGLGQAGSPPPGAVPLLGTSGLAGLFTTTSPAVDPATDTTLVRGWRSQAPQPLGDYPVGVADTGRRTASVADTLQPGPGAPEATTTVDVIERLVLASGLASLEPSGRLGYLGDANDAIDTALAPLGVPEQGTITVTSNEAVVPITLVNGRADPARVRVELTSDKLEFPDGNVVDLELEPGANRTEVTVRTRASGAFPVQLEMRTADDAVVLGEARFIVRSTAVSGIGLALSMVAGLFLALWWALRFRSARRSRNLMPLETPLNKADPDGRPG